MRSSTGWHVVWHYLITTQCERSCRYVCVCVCVCAPCWRSSGWRCWSGPGPRWTAPPPGSWRWSERTGRLWPWALWNPPCGRSPLEANAPLQKHKWCQMLSHDTRTQSTQQVAYTPGALESVMSYSPSSRSSSRVSNVSMMPVMSLATSCSVLVVGSDWRNMASTQCGARGSPGETGKEGEAMLLPKIRLRH